MHYYNALLSFSDAVTSHLSVHKTATCWLNTGSRLRVFVCVCARVRACVRVCHSSAVVCVVDFQLKHCGFNPRGVWSRTAFFLSLFGGNQRSNLYVQIGAREKRKKMAKRKEKA